MRYRYLLILALCWSLPALAADKYVSDKLAITLRTGQGNQYQIIKILESGARLKVLEETDTGYARVQLADGTEGWVRTQYLTDEPVAADRLVKVEERLAKLQERNTAMQQELKTLKQEKGQLESELNKLRGAHQSASTELAQLSELAARPKQLAEENIELRENFARMSDELTLLKQENQVLKDRSKRNWFLAGALVVVIGMIIGLIIPKLRFRKRDSWEY